VELRKSSGRSYWPLSFVGIHLMPTVWVFLGLLSVYPVLSTPGRPAGWLDALACVVVGGAVLLEAIADFQLRRFLRTRRDPSAVLETGVWSRCRHPNYLGEILFWWGLWLSGMAANPTWWWTVIGPVAITVLFLAVSAPWMDRRMLAGHPAYAERLLRVPSLIPRMK
jgi:steroid 5-alpha reductase family enzyme